MYLAYVDYQTMGGTLDEATFDNYEFLAECYVNWYTFSRLKKEEPEDSPEELARCMYLLIDLITVKMNLIKSSAGGNEGTSSSSGAIASQSNDGVSVSYNVVNASELRKAINEDEVANVIKMALDGVKDSLGRKLLYRGLYPGE